MITMTGFIKPGEIYAAQMEIIELLRDSDRKFKSLSEETKEFMAINPVTKEKEAGSFRKVDGVWVTEESYEEAESLNRPISEMVEGFD